MAAGALVVALLGAPFQIWSTVLKHRGWELQREGHMTDRISKAVEQLGAEKSISRIGRVLTVYEGESITAFLPSNHEPKGFTVRGETVDADPEAPGLPAHATLWSIWPRSTTLLEWQGQPAVLADGSHLAATGEWKPFAETVPNIEVRVGAILALERIAQDSMVLDQGRDHVRVMEILCAYIRQNAPASMAVEPPIDFATHPNPRNAKLEWKFAGQWASGLPTPRIDIQTALNLIGRRTKAQRAVEASHTTPNGGGYRLDLSSCCIQRANLAGLDFSGADFSDSRAEGALCPRARFNDAGLSGARLIGIRARKALFDGAELHATDFTAAFLPEASMLDVSLFKTDFIRANLERTAVSVRNEAKPAFSTCLILQCRLQLSRIEGDVSWTDVSLSRAISPARTKGFGRSLISQFST